jgi:hypothetical protein
MAIGARLAPPSVRRQVLVKKARAHGPVEQRGIRKHHSPADLARFSQDCVAIWSIKNSYAELLIQKVHAST